MFPYGVLKEQNMEFSYFFYSKFDALKMSPLIQRNVHQTYELFPEKKAPVKIVCPVYHQPVYFYRIPAVYNCIFYSPPNSPRSDLSQNASPYSPKN